MLADRRYCYPLTITDFASRYLFACEALSTTKEAYAFPVFEAAFKEFGLPKAIRTDNGVPFARAANCAPVTSVKACILVFGILAFISPLANCMDDGVEHWRWE